MLFSSDLSNATQSVTQGQAEIASDQDQGLAVGSGDPGTGMDGAGTTHCTNTARLNQASLSRASWVYPPALGNPTTWY